MYAIKSTYGSRYIKEINLQGNIEDLNGMYTTRNIIVYDKHQYITFLNEEEGWKYLNNQLIILEDNKHLYKKEFYYRLINSITNLCIVLDNGLEYHGKNTKDDIERFKWCKLRKYGFYK